MRGNRPPSESGPGHSDAAPPMQRSLVALSPSSSYIHPSSITSPQLDDVELEVSREVMDGEEHPSPRPEGGTARLDPPPVTCRHHPVEPCPHEVALDVLCVGDEEELVQEGLEPREGASLASFPSATSNTGSPASVGGPDSGKSHHSADARGQPVDPSGDVRTTAAFRRQTQAGQSCPEKEETGLNQTPLIAGRDAPKLELGVARIKRC